MSAMKRLFAVVCVVCIFSLLNPAPASARYIDADVQCPPGGQVNQPCKDNTNGYVTSGHCTHIYVCKADKYKSGPPKICTGGSADCPKGGDYPNPPQRYPTASATSGIQSEGVSMVEQGTLDRVFGTNGNAVDPSVDLAKISAEANAELLALRANQGKTSEEILTYTPESFATTTSSIFAHLREGAVALSIGQFGHGIPDATATAQRLAYFSGGFFGDVLPPNDSGNAGGKAQENVLQSLVDLLIAFPTLLGQALLFFLYAIGAILLADFSQAAHYAAASRIEWHLALRRLLELFTLLWQLL